VFLFSAMAEVTPISDAKVEELLQRRALARLHGDYAEADDIREELLWEGVVTEDQKDEKENLKWRRMPMAMLACRGGKGCLHGCVSEKSSAGSQ